MTPSEALSWQAHPPKGSLPAIIYTLAVTLLPFIGSIGEDHTRPWVRRTRTTSRLSRILQQMLALVARMHPRKVGQAAFNKLRPRPESTPQTPQTPQAHAKTAPRTRRRYLSARQVAARLANLLREFEAVAQADGYHLPRKIRHLFTRACTKAGCQALPPNQTKPKGFFASIMSLPPWFPLRR